MVNLSKCYLSVVSVKLEGQVSSFISFVKVNIVKFVRFVYFTAEQYKNICIFLFSFILILFYL